MVGWKAGQVNLLIVNHFAVRRLAPEIVLVLSSIELVEIYLLNFPELVFGRNLVCRDPDQNTYLAARGVVTLRDEAPGTGSTN